MTLPLVLLIGRLAAATPAASVPDSPNPSQPPTSETGARAPDSPNLPNHRAPAFAAEIEAAVADVRDVWPVPAELVRAVIRQESAFDPRAKSRAGAVGLMQVMPANAELLGVTEGELWQPAKNVLAGTRLLAVLLKHYDGDLISALVAYNAHPMRLGAPVPRNGETPGYVASVLRYYAAYSKASGAVASAR
jgi:soluble lytic murein transglycosylase-like protein